MHTMRKILAILLTVCIAVSFAACVGDSTIDVLDEIPNLNQSENSSVEESVADPEPAEGQTRMPVVTRMYNNSFNTVILSGTCEENSVITASGVNLETVTVNAKGGIFALQVNLGSNASAIVRLTATAPDKTESDVKEINVTDAQGEAGNLVNPVILSDKFVLFSEESLKVLDNQSVSFTDANDFVTKISGVNTGKGDTEIIYVLAPSRTKVLADKLPEGNEISEVSLYSQTVKALHDAGVTVIDLSEAFAEADDYPLFYDTHSNWSDYASFVAYTEIMSYIAEKFPDAAPHGMDEFKVEAVEKASLGNLAYYFGMDIEAFSETVYKFDPLFDIHMGKEFAVNTQPPPATEESGDESSEDAESSEVESAESAESSEGAESSEDAESSEGAESSEDAESSDVDTPVVEGLSFIDEVKIYMGETDFRLYDNYFSPDFYDEAITTNPPSCDTEFIFCTNRMEEYLPSALIYRSSDTAPIIPMLAERFRNSVFYRADTYTIGGTYAADYAGTPGNTNVDYIIVIVTEEELASLY